MTLKFKGNVHEFLVEFETTFEGKSADEKCKAFLDCCDEDERLIFGQSQSLNSGRWEQHKKDLVQIYLAGREINLDTDMDRTDDTMINIIQLVESHLDRSVFKLGTLESYIVSFTNLVNPLIERGSVTCNEAVKVLLHGIPNEFWRHYILSRVEFIMQEKGSKSDSKSENSNKTIQYNKGREIWSVIRAVAARLDEYMYQQAFVNRLSSQLLLWDDPDIVSTAQSLEANRKRVKPSNLLKIFKLAWVVQKKVDYLQEAGLSGNSSKLTSNMYPLGFCPSEFVQHLFLHTKSRATKDFIVDLTFAERQLQLYVDTIKECDRLYEDLEHFLSIYENGKRMNDRKELDVIIPIYRNILQLAKVYSSKSHWDDQDLSKTIFFWNQTIIGLTRTHTMSHIILLLIGSLPEKLKSFVICDLIFDGKGNDALIDEFLPALSSEKLRPKPESKLHAELDLEIQEGPFLTTPRDKHENFKLQTVLELSKKCTAGPGKHNKPDHKANLTTGVDASLYRVFDIIQRNTIGFVKPIVLKVSFEKFLNSISTSACVLTEVCHFCGGDHSVAKCGHISEINLNYDNVNIQPEEDSEFIWVVVQNTGHYNVKIKGPNVAESEEFKVAMRLALDFTHPIPTGQNIITM